MNFPNAFRINLSLAPSIFPENEGNFYKSFSVAVCVVVAAAAVCVSRIICVCIFKIEKLLLLACALVRIRLRHFATHFSPLVPFAPPPGINKVSVFYFTIVDRRSFFCCCRSLACLLVTNLRFFSFAYIYNLLHECVEQTASSLC